MAKKQAGTQSASQAEDFAKGLQELADSYKADVTGYQTSYKEVVGEAAGEVQDASHTFAQQMVSRSDQLVHDVKDLYDQTYPEGNPGTPDGGEEVPPPSSGGDWEGKPSDPHPSTGPAPIPEPKSKK